MNVVWAWEDTAGVGYEVSESEGRYTLSRNGVWVAEYSSLADAQNAVGTISSAEEQDVWNWSGYTVAAMPDGQYVLKQGTTRLETFADLADAQSRASELYTSSPSYEETVIAQPVNDDEPLPPGTGISGFFEGLGSKGLIVIGIVALLLFSRR